MKKFELRRRTITAGILLPAVILMIFYSQLIFILLLFLVLFFSFKEWFFLNKKKINLTTLFGFIFLIISIYFAYSLRGDELSTKTLFLWLILICVFSDIGGYFFGKTFGKRKITKISPNKTYAGMYGSFLFSLIPSIFVYFLEIKIIVDVSNKNELLLYYILLPLILSLVCQAGDLTISYFKRINKFKDTGNILPGHGGLLDRIDGIIFVIFFSGILNILGIL